MGSYSLNTAFGSCVDNRTLKSKKYGKIVGGSSGGSAASLMFQTSMVSIGTDTGGSVRNPANHCRMIGFKPSYGAISRYGLIPYANSLDTVGIIGRYYEDVESVFCKYFYCINFKHYCKEKISEILQALRLKLSRILLLKLAYFA